MTRALHCKEFLILTVVREKWLLVQEPRNKINQFKGDFPFDPL
jgi:hypothetical protein